MSEEKRVNKPKLTGGDPQETEDFLRDYRDRVPREEYDRVWERGEEIRAAALQLREAAWDYRHAIDPKSASKALDDAGHAFDVAVSRFRGPRPPDPPAEHREYRLNTEHGLFGPFDYERAQIEYAKELDATDQRHTRLPFLESRAVGPWLNEEHADEEYEVAADA